jgi:hypothetical protein
LSKNGTSEKKEGRRRNWETQTASITKVYRNQKLYASELSIRVQKSVLHKKFFSVAVGSPPVAVYDELIASSKSVRVSEKRPLFQPGTQLL